MSSRLLSRTKTGTYDSSAGQESGPCPRLSLKATQQGLDWDSIIILPMEEIGGR